MVQYEIFTGSWLKGTGSQLRKLNNTHKCTHVFAQYPHKINLGTTATKYTHKSSKISRFFICLISLQCKKRN